MISTSAKGAAGAAPTFDPRAWLTEYVSAGGAYVLTLHGAPIFLVADMDGHFLTAVMSDIVGRPDRLSAVRAAMEAGL